MPNQDKTIKVLKKREVLKNDLALGIAGELTNIEEKVDNLTEKVIEQENVPTVKVEGISLITLKGDIGEKGDTGEKGEQGEPGKDGIDGKNGTNGRDGKNGNDGKNGKNGLDGLDGKNGLDGKDGSPDTAEDIVAKINELPTDEDDFKIDAKHIKNLPKQENRPNAIGVSNKYLDQLLDVDLTGVTKTDGKYVLGSGGSGSGVQSIVAGTNISVDNTDPANPIVASLSDRYKTTSTTSQAIVSTGTLTFTVDADLAYTPQQDVIIAYDSSNHMHGTVTSYSGTTLVVDIQHKTGAGTYTSWVINLDAILATTLTLKTDGTDNGSQTTLNLVAGSNIDLTDNGAGSVTIATTVSNHNTKVYQSAPQALTGGSYTTLTFDTELIDTSGMFSLANPTRLTIVEDGVYDIAGQSGFAANSISGARIKKNGSTIIASETQGNSGIGERVQILAQTEPLLVGDYVEIEVYSTPSQNTTGDIETNFAISKSGNIGSSTIAYLFENGVQNVANHIKLGGNIDSNTTLETYNSGTGKSLKINNSNTGSEVGLETNGDAQIKSSTKVKIATPLSTSKSVGDVFTLVDPATGEGEYQTPSSTGSSGYTVQTQTADNTLGETSGDQIMLVDATTGAVTLTLPTAVGNTAKFTFKKIDSSANTVTIACDGSETIDLDATAIINYQNTAFTIISDNTNWQII